MDEVIILVEGYAHPGPDSTYVASPTCCVVISSGKKFLVDPGTNAEALTRALKKNKIDERTIAGIYLSHYHPDHFLNIRLFPNLDIYDGTTRWSGDKEIFYKDKIPGTNIRILSTPGHSPEDASLLVETAKGKVCIAPDVFWWEDGQQKNGSREELLDQEDPFASDRKLLIESRKMILNIADYIIPGHGKMFKNPER